MKIRYVDFALFFYIYRCTRNPLNSVHHNVIFIYTKELKLSTLEIK